MKFSLPEGAEPALRVEPGRTVIFSIEVRSQVDFDTLPFEVVREDPFPSNLGVSSLDFFEFEAQTPSVCSAPQRIDSRRSSITIGAVPARAQRLCVYSIHRRSESISDASFTLNNTCVHSVAGYVCSFEKFLVGTVPDISLRIERITQVRPGATEALFRATVRNDSSVAIQGPGFGECSYNQPFPFPIDSELDGGCETGYTPVCFGGGFGFTVPDVPANVESSCLIRLLFPPIQSPYVAYIGIESTQYRLDNGGKLLDSNFFNNFAPLGVAFVVPRTIPISLTAVSLLAILLAAFAFVSLGASRRP